VAPTQVGGAPTASGVGDESFSAKDCPQLAARGFGAAYRYGRRRAIRCGRADRGSRCTSRVEPHFAADLGRTFTTAASLRGVIVQACPQVETPLQPINQGHRYDDDKPMTHKERMAYYAELGCVDVRSRWNG
jgi:hypothetical protein